MATYPLPAFHFRVEWGGVTLGFTEVSGLNMSKGALASVTLKRGVYHGDNYSAWLSKIQSTPSDIIISLLNEHGRPAAKWKLRSARIVKIEGPSLSSEGNEAAIESIEITHEGLSLQS